MLCGYDASPTTLYLMNTESRFLYGQEMSPTPSRFLREIPSDRIEEIRARKTTISSGNSSFSAPKHSTEINETGFNPGQEVHHHKFGGGTVIDTEGSGKSARVQVNFKHAGTKWLVTAYAKLEKV